MQRVVIFGTAEFAQVAHAYLARSHAFEVVAFTAHDRHVTDRHLLGCPVVPFERLEEQYPPDQFAMLVAVGYTRLNKARTELYHACRNRGYSMISYIDDRAMCTGVTSIGDNCFVFEANVIQPFVQIGNNVILWSGNHVGHHTSIGDNCFIASHAVIASSVTIEDNCFIGINATIRDGVRIARDCIIGAGVTILKDTEEAAVYRAEATSPAQHRSHRWRV